MSRNSQFLYAELLAETLPVSTRWLDLGCGHRFLPEWASPDPAALLPTGMTVAGIDADLGALRRHRGLTLKTAGDVEHLPFADGSFDLVTANMVLEHVSDPTLLFAEVARVLRPSGRFLFHTPNAGGYTTALARLIPSALRPWMAARLQGRHTADVYPTHYRANRLTLLRGLAADCHLAPVLMATVNSSAQLFRVPVAGWLETQWLRLLSLGPLWRWRPCILGVLVKSGEVRGVTSPGS